jgi:hypothetical protein
MRIEDNRIQVQGIREELINAIRKSFVIQVWKLDIEERQGTTLLTFALFDRR